MSEFTSVHHLALTVTDIDRSVPWYERVLDLAEITRREDPESGVRKAVLRARGGAFVLVLVQHPGNERGSFDERRIGLDHVAFGVGAKDELARWEERLSSYGVTYTPNVESRTIPGFAAVVFRDPDGIQVEVWADAN